MNYDDDNEFNLIKFYSGLSAFLGLASIVLGFILTILVLKETDRYSPKIYFTFAWIPTILGAIVGFLFLLHSQFINLFLKIEKNTYKTSKNQDTITLLKEQNELLKKISNTNTVQTNNTIPINSNVSTTISNNNQSDSQQSISSNKDKFGLVNVRYIKCPTCGNRNYIDSLESLKCNQCGTNISNGERFSN